MMMMNSLFEFKPCDGSCKDDTYIMLFAAIGLVIADQGCKKSSLECLFPLIVHIALHL